MSEVSQICYTSRDIEATALALAKLDGFGPFYFAEFPLHDLVFDGKPYVHPTLKVAFAYKGELQVELIEMGDNEESPYAVNLKGRREGFHHTYVKTDELFDSIVARHAAAGEQLIYHGRAGDDKIRFGFIDARARLGHFIEVLETNPPSESAAFVEGLYDIMKRNAKEWDGSRPIRRMSELL